jgi:diguanylate cyclase (GGDEF)-like protein
MMDIKIRAKAHSENPTKTVVEAGRFKIIVDEPKNQGGTDDGPTPVDYLLAGLAGCINVVGHVIAKEMGFELRGMDIQLEGDLNPARFMGKFDLYKKEKENEIYKLKNIKLKELNKKLKAAYENAEWLANIDFLTRIHNRRSISQYINENFIKKEIPFTIVLSDIDDFKSINDTCGHVAGDYVLTETVTRLQSCLEDNCKIARWGGEEFLTVLPNTSLDQGISIAERLRQSICSTPYLYNNNVINVTMTFGVSEYNKGDTFDDLIKKADSALYTGKSRGKNCVV